MNAITKLSILLLLRCSNGIPSNKSHPSTAKDAKPVELFRRIDHLCSPDNEVCKPQCCQLSRMYSSAISNCTTDIDGQLAAAKWSPGFFKFYHPFWKSMCSPKLDLPKHYLPLVNNSHSCKNFDKLFLNYTNENFGKCSSRDNSTSWEALLDGAKPVEVVHNIDQHCFTIEACQPQCCKLYRMYSIAKSNCTTIDGQLEAVKWFSPFSKVYHRFWKSVCSSSHQRFDDQHSLSFVNGSYSCHYFVEFSLKYTGNNINFEECGSEENHSWWKICLDQLIMFINTISIIAEVIAVILYLAVPYLYERIQDKCFLFYLTSQLICSILTSFLETPSVIGCYFVAFTHQLIGLAGLFWFNVLCIHLWCTLKKIIHPSSNATLGYYSLYAFGSALLITVITQIADRWLPNDSPFRPRIGEPYCLVTVYNYALGSAWLQPIFIYYYSISFFLLIINSCAFIDIVRTILAREKRFSGQIKELRRHQKQQLGITTYTKLFVLMGTANLLSWIGYLFGSSFTVRMIACLPSLLNGICMLWIVVCNKRDLKAVKDRFSRKNQIAHPETNTTRLTTATK